MKLLVGFDDHDSPIGGCTTHFTSFFIKSVLTGELKAKLIGLPRLVRLNPAIPWKTRGNAATVVELEYDDAKEVYEFIEALTETYDKEVSKGTAYGRKPGAVVVEEKSENEELLEWVYRKAVSDVLTFDVVERVLERVKALYLKSRGSIGSLAALGFSPVEGYTYELLIYRKPGVERPKGIDFVRELEETYFPKIFYNYDFQKRVVIAEPRGDDPVLLGIRGVDKEVLTEKVYPIVKEKLNEYIAGAMIYVTNQHTGAHIRHSGRPVAYRSTVVKGRIIDHGIYEGGDVELKIDTEEFGTLTVLVFKETGLLAKVAKSLDINDIVSVEGIVKPSESHGLVVEAEAIEILSLNSVKPINPRCPTCGGPTESLGRSKGFRCKKCGFRFVGEKALVEVERDLTLGRVVSSRPRHLTPFPFVDVPKGPNEGDHSALLLKLVGIS